MKDSTDPVGRLELSDYTRSVAPAVDAWPSVARRAHTRRFAIAWVRISRAEQALPGQEFLSPVGESSPHGGDEIGGDVVLSECVWARSQERFAAQVAGPHFEAVCREFMLGDGIDVLGPDAGFGEVGCGIVTDSSARKQIQIDVAVMQPGDGGHKAAVSMLGEAKWGVCMGVNHVDRLVRARELLAGNGLDVSNCRLACFSGVGFSDALRERAARDSDVLLIGLAQLYGREEEGAWT